VSLTTEEGILLQRLIELPVVPIAAHVRRPTSLNKPAVVGQHGLARRVGGISGELLFGHTVSEVPLARGDPNCPHLPKVVADRIVLCDVADDEVGLCLANLRGWPRADLPAVEVESGFRLAANPSGTRCLNA